jgi:hypothetical protein
MSLRAARPNANKISVLNFDRAAPIRFLFNQYTLVQRQPKHFYTVACLKRMQMQIMQTKMQIKMQIKCLGCLCVSVYRLNRKRIGAARSKFRTEILFAFGRATLANTYNCSSSYDV